MSLFDALPALLDQSKSLYFNESLFIALDNVHFEETIEKENTLSVKIEGNKTVCAVARAIDHWITFPVLDSSQTLLVELPIELKTQLAQLLDVQEDAISVWKSNNEHLFSFDIYEYTVISKNVLCILAEKLFCFVEEVRVQEIGSVLFPTSLAGSFHFKLTKEEELFNVSIYNLFGIECGRMERIISGRSASPIIMENSDCSLSSSFSDISNSSISVQTFLDSKRMNAEASTLIISCLEEMHFDISSLSSSESFLSFGLDSLDLVDLGQRLSKKLGVEIPVDVLDRDTTLEKLSQFVNGYHLSQKKEKEVEYRIPNKRPSKWQRRILLADSIESNLRAQFNEVISFKILEEINPKKLQEIILSLTMANPNLRAHYSYNKKIFLPGTESYFLPLKMTVDELIRRKIELSSELPIWWNNEGNRVNLVVHHVTVDGYSLQLLLSQFQSLLQGSEISIDRSVFTESQMETEVDSPTQIVENERLPSDFSLSKGSSRPAQQIKRTFPVCLSKFLRNLRRLCKCTDYEIFLAGFSICLSKRTGAEEISIGTAISVREENQLSTVDCLVSVVPIGISIENLPINEFVRKVAKRLEAIKKNVRNTETGPIQFLLVMDKIDSSSSDVELLEIIPAVCKYEQTWYFRKIGGEYELIVEFCSDLYREDSIHSTVDDLFLILREMAQFSERLTRSLNLSGRSEEKKKRDYPSKLISNMPQFKKYPEMSWSFSGKEITSSSQILSHSQALSWTFEQKYLQIYGEIATSDRQIIMFLPRGLQMGLSALASWNLGMAIVPISRDWPHQRIIEFVKSLYNPLVLTENLELISALQRENIGVHFEPSVEPIERKFWNRLSNVSMGYITCTSGSTGLPKAVCSSIRGLSNLAMNYAKTFSVNSLSRIYQVVNYGFDIFFADLCKSLANGASMIFARDSIPNWNELKTCSNAYIMPAILSSLPNEIISNLKSLESLQFGGEGIRPAVLEKLLKTGIHLFQEFGLTEQCVYSSVLRLKKGTDSSSLGIPYSNLSISVRDCSSTVIQSNGSRGELFVKGFIARGYLGLEKENKERFIKGEFRTRDEVIFYQSGYKFVGRMDLQVKIAGRRIEIGEIETIICGHKKVEAAVVTVVEDKIFGHVISKVLKNQFSHLSLQTDPSELNDHLTQLLPSYMIPEKIVFIEKFPLNANGKIDKKRLLIPKEEIVEQMKEPANELEKIICRAMGKILGISIGVNECFFRKGGNSVKAMLVLQILQESGYNFKIKDFFDTKTAEKLASFVNKGASQFSNEVAEKEEFVSLSHVQRRLWFIQKLEPDRDCYHFHLRIEFHSERSRDQFQRALLRVINANIYLRSQIVELDGAPFWKIRHQIEEINSSEFVNFSENSLKINHLVIDGRSLALLVEQIEKVLSEEEIQNKSDNLWIREDETDFEFWQNKFEGVELYNFPPRSPPFLNEVGRLQIGIPSRLLNRLSENLFPEILSAVAKTVRKIFDEEDIVIGTTVANRNLENYDCVGLFANTLPIRIKGEISKKTMTDEISKVLEHQNSSLEKIQQLVGGELIKCIVNYQNTSLNAAELSFGKIFLEETRSAQFPLSWIFSDQQEGILLTLEYDKSLFGEDDAESFGKWFLLELKQFVYKKPKLPKFREEKSNFPQRTINRIMVEQAKRCPKRTAFETEIQKLSYESAFFKSFEVSYRLEQMIFINSGRSPRSDDIIALCMDEGTNLHLAINAALLLGCAYTVVPSERKDQILQSCSPVLILEEIDGLLLSPKNRNYFEKIDSTNLMYIMFTSGSTGRPKGVPIDHRGAANMLVHATKLYSFHPGARILQFTKSYFDASISNTFGALTNGSILCLLDRNREATQAVSSLLPLHVLHMTPTILDYLSEEKSIQDGVQKWSIGGETPSASVAKRVQKGTRIIQLYGPTEATCYQTAHYLRAGDSVSCVGHPVFNLPNALSVWEEVKEETKGFKDVGQFICGGVQLSRGYLREEEKNKKSFMKNAFRSNEDRILRRNPRIYLTGDRLYSDPSERLHFIGRRDEQIKISGNRIEIGEVEAAMRQLGGIKNAVVVIQKDPANRRHLIGFFTGNGEISEINLKSILPAHMIPVRIIKLDSLPLTSNGKINRKELSLRKDLHHTNQDLAIPKELEILKIYQDLLNEKRMTVSDSFYHFGGNSLLAVRLAHLIEKHFEVNIPLAKVFSEDTPRKMTKFLEGLESNSFDQSISTRPSQLQLPLLRMFRSRSFQQIYTNQTRIRLLKEIENLEELFKEIMEVHPGLRTIYTRKGKEIIQETYEMDDSLKVVSTIDEQLDVFRGFPILVQSKKGEILLKTSHISVDGHSMRILVENIETILAGGKLKEKDKFMEFNAYIDRHLESYRDISADFWKKKLSDFKLNPLIKEETHGQVSYESNSVSMKLKGSLNQLAKANKTTPFCVFLSLVSTALRGLVVEENEPISIAFPVNMRIEEFKYTVTMGVNLSLVLLPNRTIETLLIQETAQLVTESLAHPILLNNLKEITSSKLFEVMVTFDEYSTYKSDYFEVIREPEKFSKCEISIFVGNGEILIDYMKESFKEETILKLLYKIEEILTGWTSCSVENKVPDSLPLTASQKQMFVSSFFSNRSLPFVIRIPPQSNNFHQILQLLVQKHEAFRSVFFLDESGEPRQKILSLTESYRLIRTGKYEKESPPESIQMDSNVLEVVSTGEFLVLWLHHIATDAWSTKLLENDLKELLSKGIFETERPKQLMRNLKETKREIQRGYLKALLSSEKFTKQSNSMKIFIDSFEISKIEGNIFAKVVRSLTKSLNVSLNVGFPFANRNPKNSKIIGYFLNNLVINVDKNDSEKCISEKKNQLISQNIPYTHLIDQFRRETQKDESLFDVYVNCRYDLESLEEEDKEIASMLPLSCEFPLEIDIDSSLVTYKVKIRAREAYFSKESYESLIQKIKGEFREEDDFLGTIIKIVERILKRRVDENSNFFTAGGNSLQAIELAEEIEDIFGLDVDMDIIYQTDSLKEIVAKLRKGPIEDNNTVLPQSPSKEIQGKLKDFPKFNFAFKVLSNSPRILFKESTGKSISYSKIIREIQQQAFSISQEIIKLTGILPRPDNIIPVIGSKSIEIWTTCLAIQLLGSAYLPISSMLPLSNIQDILTKADCHFYTGESLNLEAPKIEIIPSKIAMKHTVINGSNLAYVISTSGTTGTPKMVCAQHKGVMNMASAAVQDLSLNSRDVIYQFTNFCYDNSVLEVFSALVSSAQLLLDTVTFTPRRFAKQIVDERISHCLLFPGLVNQFKKESFEAMKHLRYWVAGAEKLQYSLLNRAIENGINVIQNYGPTETTCYCLTRQMNEGDLATNLGKPIQNIIVKVTNGELFVSGNGLMRGYLNRCDSFLPENGRKWYQTGDFVEQTKDDSLVFVSRKDSQVKIRGQRVELGEIEEKILLLTGVEECKVRWNESTLTAFCVTLLPEEQLQEHCKSVLPLHMRPNQIRILKQFPLTENSKIDFKTMEKPGNSLLKIARTFFNELSGTLLERGCTSFQAIQIQKKYEDQTGNFASLEQLLTKPLKMISSFSKRSSRVTQAWEKVLGHSDFNQKSNFLLSGGTSLHIFRLKIELERLGLNLLISQLMENVILENMEKLDIPRTVVVLSDPESPIRTLVLVHTLYGGSTAYLHLIPLLEDGKTRILAVEHPNSFTFSTEKSEFFESFDSLSQIYSQQLKEYLKGEILLCGFSIGGTLAVEITRKLDKKPKKVILVDTLAEPDLSNYTMEFHKNKLEKDLPEELNESILINSWDLLQMLKNHQWKNVEFGLTLLSVDGSDLSWRSRDHD